MPKLKLATLEVVGSIWFSHIETLNSLKSTPPTPTAHTPASCVCLGVPLVLPLGLWLSSGHRRRRSLLYKFMRSGAIWWPGWGGGGRGQLLSFSLSCGPGISMAFLPFFTCPPTPIYFCALATRLYTCWRAPDGLAPKLASPSLIDFYVQISYVDQWLAHEWAPWGAMLSLVQSGACLVQRQVQCCFLYSGMQAGLCKLRRYMGGASVMN